MSGRENCASVCKRERERERNQRGTKPRYFFTLLSILNRKSLIFCLMHRLSVFCWMEKGARLAKPFDWDVTHKCNNGLNRIKKTFDNKIRDVFWSSEVIGNLIEFFLSDWTGDLRMESLWKKSNWALNRDPIV